MSYELFGVKDVDFVGVRLVGRD